MGKIIVRSIVLLLIGGIFGGVLAYSYFKESTLQSLREDKLSQFGMGNCSVNISSLSKEELKEGLGGNLSEADIASAAAYLKFKKIKESFIPSGTPAVYGQELGLSFDAVQDAIDKVAPLDLTYGQEKITLTGTDLERYIKIGSQTSCEYCCGATTLVFEDGSAACGCAHSQMMRGLAAYLIKNHPEFSDEQILKELNTWKITYFPKQTLSSYLEEMKARGEEGIEQLLSEFPEFMPEMVGGC